MIFEGPSHLNCLVVSINFGFLQRLKVFPFFLPEGDAIEFLMLVQGPLHLLQGWEIQVGLPYML